MQAGPIFRKSAWYKYRISSRTISLAHLNSTHQITTMTDMTTLNCMSRRPKLVFVVEVDPSLLAYDWRTIGVRLAFGDLTLSQRQVVLMPRWECEWMERGEREERGE